MALPLKAARLDATRDLASTVNPRAYDPRDFSYYEDAERRWTGVAIYGAILLVTAALAPGPSEFIHYTL
jgi:hypothetical protein